MIKFNMLNKKAISILQYSIIKYIVLALGFIKGIINAKFLGPELLGVLGNLALIMGYCSYANLGILYSMNREYILYKDNDEKKANEVLNTVFTSLMVLSIFFIFSSLGAVLIYKNTYGIYISISFIIAISEQYRNYYINYFRLKDDYKMINRIEIISNIISVILTIILISNLKVFGVLIAMLVCGIAVFIIGFRKMKNLSIGIDKEILKLLILTGIPLLIYNLGFYILTTIDRILIIRWYSSSDLGNYTFANSMVNATLVFVSSLLFLLYPKVIKAFNEEQSSNIIEKVNVYTLILEMASVLFITLGVIIFKPFINIFLKEYYNSTELYILLLMSIVMSNISYFSNCYIVSNKKQKYLVYLQVLAIIMNLGLSFIFMTINMGVKGVALGTFLANSVYSIAQYNVFIKLNTGKFNLVYVFKVFSRFIIYSLFLILTVLLDLNYILFVVVALLLMILLYIKKVLKLKYYLSIIKNN